MPFQPNPIEQSPIKPQESVKAQHIVQSEQYIPWWKRPFIRKKGQKPSEIQNNADFAKEYIIRQAAWDAKRREIDQITDRLNIGVDKGIKETVVAFQTNGINTTNSCEGHLDHGLASPFVNIGAPNRPTDRFNRETEIFQQVAAAHNMSVMEMRRSETPEARQAYLEANTQAYVAGETDEFAHWREATDQLGRKTEELLNEFYGNRTASPEVKLVMEQLDDGLWTLTSGTEESLDDKMFLQQRQAEMRVFTDFLRVRYFNKS